MPQSNNIFSMSFFLREAQSERGKSMKTSSAKSRFWVRRFGSLKGNFFFFRGGEYTSGERHILLHSVSHFQETNLFFKMPINFTYIENAEGNFLGMI